MKKVLYLAIVFLGLEWSTPAQIVPKTLWGKWIVRRELPTTTVSCWDEKEAKTLIGTELEYSPEVFRWRNIVTKNPAVETTTVTALRFHDENSGGGADSSRVTFQQLGIKEEKAVQIVIRHPAASITGATVQIPGDYVLLKDRNTIIFAVCNMYFEAKRTLAPSRN